MTYEELLAENRRLKETIRKYEEGESHGVNSLEKISFNDLFNIKDIQKIQDLFAESTGVASIITDTDGNPLTKPSNFCRLCNDVIRKTEKGLKNCYYSDAIIGKHNVKGANYQPCLSGGLWDAGASITVGGNHIANWLIGQVKNNELDEKDMLDYAKEIGADKKKFKEALDEVNVMSTEKFKKIADMLYMIANEISEKAYHIIVQNRLIAQLKEKEKEVKGHLLTVESHKNYLFALINSIPDLIWLKDIDGVYMECNARFEDFFGAKRNAIVGKTDYDFVDKDLADFFRANDNAAMKAGKPTVNEEQITFASDGHKEFLETIKTPILDSNNRIIGVLGIGRDITQRMLAEQNILKSKEKAEESDRLKSAFLQNMSHEIRTPLNAISGFSDLLNNKGLTLENRKRYTSIISKSTKQLISIVTDILTMSRLETGQEELNVSEMGISDLFSELYDVFVPEVKIRDQVELKRYDPKELHGLQVYADKTKVYQVLANLISNAIKFTDIGKVEFGCSIQNNFIEFFVKDTGIGLEAGMKELIFERFRQADISISSKYGGTGLGLSISKGFVEMMGGRIWVESFNGKGADFYFTIPFKPVEKKETKRKSNAAKKKPTVLVAEDEENNFELIKELLTDFDVEIIYSENGKQAIDECKRNIAISLILMDIKMPVLDGYEAAKEIKTLRPDLPIIAQSAYAMGYEIEKFGKTFDGYLTKPIDVNAFNEEINKFI